MPVHPSPCCAPTKPRLERLATSIQASFTRARATTGSLENMVRLEGGPFYMGSESPAPFPADGEGPVRRITLSAFYISKFAVTSEQFAEFVRKAGYRTEAERFGWSFVFRNHVPKLYQGPAQPGTPWWVQVKAADWSHPEGPGSSVAGRAHHPAVHVSWNDAAAYCAWAGYRLPTEAEWEFAARGGLEQKLYPWGDELTPEGRRRWLHQCRAGGGLRAERVRPIQRGGQRLGVVRGLFRPIVAPGSHPARSGRARRRQHSRDERRLVPVSRVLLLALSRCGPYRNPAR